MIALPDDLSVGIVAVPHLRAIPAAAVGALDPAGENADATPAVGAWTPCHHKGLHHLEGLPVDDGFVVIAHIVLRNLALVDLFLLGEEVDCVGLLQEGVALVLFVREDAADVACVPLRLAAGRWDAFCRQRGGYLEG